MEEWQRNHHRRPTRFEVDLAAAAGMTPSMLRFVTVRMATELVEGRRIEDREVRRIWTMVH